MTDLHLGGSRLGRTAGYLRIDGVWQSPDGTLLTDADALDRLRKLAIPPAWVHVWASEDPDARVQATGVDARGRTQYRYATAATVSAALDKFEHMLSFAESLPMLRKQVSRDLSGKSIGAELTARPVIAAVVRLLERGLFRVGNERYARDNHTYGLTTLRRSQLSMSRSLVSFDFVGKEHLEHHIAVKDAVVAKVVRKLAEQPLTPDDQLFAILAGGAARPVHSTEVNAYLHAHTAAPATAKVFRTWGATAAASAVAGGAVSPDGAGTKSVELRAIRTAARLLGDTPTVARAAYVHPSAIRAGESRSVVAAIEDAAAWLGTRDVGVIFVDETVQLAIVAALRSATSSSIGD